MTTEQRHWILCGGLASGKSMVRRLLAEAGVATIDADTIGHLVVRSDGPAFVEVAGRWPHVVKDGEIDRRSLAAVVFNDQAELASLESLTHPHIFDTIRAEVEKIEGHVVVEVPLLSHGLGADWKRMVTDSRDEVRLARATAGGMDEDDARARMASQPTRAEWLGVADLVIPNHGEIDALRRTTERVLDLFVG